MTTATTSRRWGESGECLEGAVVHVELDRRFLVEEPIGRGGMAHVYRAVDRHSGRRVAIKVLRPELSVSLGADRFLREIRVAANLQHPNILGLYDSGEVDGLLYYVMPFVEGESLRVRIQRGPLSVRIKSTLGRTGEPGAVRVVAHVSHPPHVALHS